ncbi:MAG: hypothetical protein ABL962_18225, partial [Fimbriimonadaceae bacterium]
TSTFTSEKLRARLKRADWPKRIAPFEFAPDFKKVGIRFDLADAYTYSYIAQVELWHPVFAHDGDTFRPWPHTKIRRQFQRALSQAGLISQEEKEHLYFALVRSASRSQEWWKGIEEAVTARGDVAGDSREKAAYIFTWLYGVSIGRLETQYVKAGVQLRLNPRPVFRK